MKYMLLSLLLCLSFKAFASDCASLLLPSSYSKDYAINGSGFADISFKKLADGSVDLQFGQTEVTEDILGGQYPDERTLSVRSEVNESGDKRSLIYVTWSSGGDKVHFVNASLFEFNEQGRLLSVTLEMNTAMLHPDLLHPEVRSLLTVPEEGQVLKPFVYGADTETAYMIALRILGQELSRVNLDIAATAQSLISAATSSRPVDIKADLQFRQK